jgi:hypothetical protein
MIDEKIIFIGTVRITAEPLKVKPKKRKKIIKRIDNELMKQLDKLYK